MQTAVRFMHHPTSQPCRAVHQLLLENGIPFEDENGSAKVVHEVA